ncbi:endoribonuclease SymE [Citrobacter sp. Cu233]|uniref:endoribonuclease SymE n=1 Tax=Citrobacter sp. Cu233 TaxID=2985160 RepID=UPI0025774DE8|nr:endoribonuclease SymE [Citrobacter sp. Cu233]MDM2935576.1 endoribonuclease SymE [Citrobacter sp. Cu233]
MTTPHSIAEFTDPEVSPENNRKGTVSYASRFEDHQRIPAIIMKGQWLEAAGFATGTKIDIKVMDGCIVLTAKPPEPEEPALLQSLRRVCKLSARKQQQVQEFIEVISGKSRKQEE